LKFFVDSIATLGPGLAGWDAARPVLAGSAPYVPMDMVLPRFEALPATERRRVGLPVKLALSVGLQALGQAGVPADAVPTVFTSSGGDGVVIHEICDMLAGTDRLISPTRFHNSVHNAPSGYWGIATGSRASSTSLCAFDWSFAAGLMEAAGLIYSAGSIDSAALNEATVHTGVMAQAGVAPESVLLVAYDAPYPEPLNAVRPIRHPFACALLLSRARSARTLAACRLEIRETGCSSRMQDDNLEQLRLDNPAARSLPLLAALSGARESDAGEIAVVIESTAGNAIALSIAPG